MSKQSETWYDRQALISKLISYAAIFILFGSIIWALWVLRRGMEHTYVVDQAIVIGLGGVTIAGFLVGLSAIIDLLIVNAEAIRVRGRR